MERPDLMERSTFMVDRRGLGVHKRKEAAALMRDRRPSFQVFLSARFSYWIT